MKWLDGDDYDITGGIRLQHSSGKEFVIWFEGVDDLIVLPIKQSYGAFCGRDRDVKVPIGQTTAKKPQLVAAFAKEVSDRAFRNELPEGASDETPPSFWEMRSRKFSAERADPSS